MFFPVSLPDCAAHLSMEANIYQMPITAAKSSLRLLSKTCVRAEFQTQKQYQNVQTLTPISMLMLHWRYVSAKYNVLL